MIAPPRTAARSFHLFGGRVTVGRRARPPLLVVVIEEAAA